MAQALTRVTKKFGNLVISYVDGVIIATSTLADYFDRLDEVFDCMKRVGLKCKPSKCDILRDSIKRLGRMVDRHDVRPDPGVVEVGRVKLEDPQNRQAAPELLGTCQLLPRLHERISRQGVPNAATNAQQREEVLME